MQKVEERREAMRKSGDRPIVLVVSLALLLALSTALYAGCGAGGSSSYTKAVLDQWSGLEGDSEELVEAAQEIADEADLEDYSELLSDAEDNAASFEDELGDLKVPSELDESNEALEDFLSAYADYLKALRKNLDAVIAGEELDYTPDLDTPAIEAEDALEEYQDSQDYNEADLDRDIWDLPGFLGEAIVDVYGDVIIDDNIDGDDVIEGGFNTAQEAVDAWYNYFNLGDGDAMWYLIDLESPMLMDYSYDSFTTFVIEVNANGLQACPNSYDVEETTDADGDWTTVYMTVDYSESLGMENEIIPRYSDDVTMELVNRGDGWFVYDVFSDSDIW